MSETFETELVIQITQNLPNILCDFCDCKIDGEIEVIVSKLEELSRKTEIKQLTREELREQFNELDSVEPYLESNDIMQAILDNLFEIYVECARANGILKEE